MSERTDVVTVVRCTICLHERRLDIEKALEDSRPETSIALEFGVSRAAVGRHKQHSVRKTADVAGRKAELQRRLGKARDDKDYALLSRELRALEEHELRVQQQEGVDKPLHELPGFQTFLTHLLNTIGECSVCREAVLEAGPPGDTPPKQPRGVGADSPPHSPAILNT